MGDFSVSSCIRNFCNELYARDTAKKIKSTMRMKGESGKHLTTNPPFGYVKDEKDRDKWLIDEDAAKTVRYIYQLCCEGFGPTQIAKRLKRERVLTPMAYKVQKCGGLLPERPFDWAHNTVAGILDTAPRLTDPVQTFLHMLVFAADCSPRMPYTGSLLSGLTMVGYLLRVTVILIHAFRHHPDAQPETKDEIFTRRDAVNIILGFDQFGK